MAPGLQTLTANQTTANIPLLAANQMGPGTVEFEITVSLGNSGGGGRPTNNAHVLMAIGTLNATKLSTEFDKQITQTNFDGSPQFNCGFFVPPGPDGSGGDDPRNLKIAETLVNAGSTGLVTCEGANLLEAPEVQLGQVAGATGLYQIVNNSIEILDLVTGKYAIGPSDAMAFGMKIVT